jgi:hypothetical protein
MADMTLVELVFRLGEMERRTPRVLGREVEELSVEIGSTGSACLAASLVRPERPLAPETAERLMARLFEATEAQASVADLGQLCRILRGEERPVWVIPEVD